MKEISLTHGHVTIVDDADYEQVAKYAWYAQRTGKDLSRIRAARSARIDGKHTQLMHRLIIDAQPGDVVDHIDGDPLNNQRSNLRLVTQLQNNMNRRSNRNSRSGFRGVSFHTRENHWQASFWWNKKRIHLGCFGTAEEAAMAWDNHARQLHGPYARLNFPLPNEQPTRWDT